jgi:hypothetical protein
VQDFVSPGTHEPFAIVIIVGNEATGKLSSSGSAAYSELIVPEAEVSWLMLTVNDISFLSPGWSTTGFWLKEIRLLISELTVKVTLTGMSFLFSTQILFVMVDGTL